MEDLNHETDLKQISINYDLPRRACSATNKPVTADLLGQVCEASVLKCVGESHRTEH